MQAWSNPSEPERAQDMDTRSNGSRGSYQSNRSDREPQNVAREIRRRLPPGNEQRGIVFKVAFFGLLAYVVYRVYTGESSGSSETSTFGSTFH